MKRNTFLLCGCLFATSAFAQTGFPPYGSFQSGRFDSINRQNLNVISSIPVVSTPGRGSSFTFAVGYNSLIWVPAYTWYPVTDATGTPTWGWNKDSMAGWSNYNVISDWCTGSHGFQEPTTEYNDYSYVDPAGTLHRFILDFYDTATVCHLPTGPRTGYATDGSGYFLDATTPYAPTVYTPAGMVIGSGGSITDTNGNSVSPVVVSGSETDWIDTVGRTTLKIIKNSTYTDYQYADNTGAYQTIRMNFSTFQIKTNFACAGIIEYTGSASLPVSVVYMANNTSYSFTYEATPGSPGYVTGRLQRVTLPTGGYYEYDYPATPNNGINCADGNINSLTRVLNDGTTSNTWQYTRTQIDSSHWKTTVTAPQLPYDAAANQTTFTFTNGQETSQKIYQGSEATGTLLRTINTTWATGPATKTTILENNQQGQVATSYDSFGNLLSMNEYDWGSGAPGALLRTTTMTYLSGGAYTSLNIRNRVTQKIVKDGAGTVKLRTDTAYDGTSLTCVTGGYACTFTTRGNPTSATEYADPVALTGAVTKNSIYDSAGNLRQADVDCCQQKTWAYSTTTQYAWPDSETSGAAGGPQTTTSKTYNFNTGLMITSTDENNQVTTYAYDTMKRLTNIGRADSSHVTYTYDDVAQTATVGNPIQGTDQRREKSFLDGLGRTVKRQVLDASGTSYSIFEVQLDAMGRPYRASNPHNSTAQYWFESRYDALDRKLKLIPPDGSPTANNTSYLYAGNAVTATDPAGEQRKLQFDFLRRQTSVYEPDVNNGNALTQQTSYGYTVFDAVASVNQGSQTRTYTYNGLRRLTSETTPEAGTISYQYNQFSLKTQRTDPLGVITTYSYDTLNRPTGTTYNVGTTGVPATPGVTYAYGTDPNQNNNDRLVTMNDGLGYEAYSYDVMGRVAEVRKTVNGTQYTLDYSYNLEGKPISMTYPSGRVVQQTYDTIGRLTTVSSGATTYSSGFVYNPAGLATAFNHGNGVAASFGYIPERLLLQSLSYSKGAQTLFSLTYGYMQNGGNNGQITSITDNVDAGRTVNYTYDALGRIVTAGTQGSAGYPQWGLSWTYDRYGNRGNQTQTSDGPPTNSVTPSPTTNKISDPTPPYTYEPRGNMTGDGLNTLGYDAENRPVSNAGGSSTTYAYDGNNLRVKKQVTSGTTTVYVFDGTRVIAEYDNGAAPAAPSREYIYSRGVLLATIEGAATKYHHQDQLSVRLTTDSTGTTIGQQGHYPYGETWYASGTTTKWQFTSYERDAESGNDYAVYRSYVNRLARFSSWDLVRSDPAHGPQGLNRYSYVVNDPVNHTDPTGQIFFGILRFCTDGRRTQLMIDGVDFSWACELLFDALIIRELAFPPPSCVFRFFVQIEQVRCLKKRVVPVHCLIAGPGLLPGGGVEVQNVFVLGDDDLVQADGDGKARTKFGQVNSSWIAQVRFQRDGNPGQTGQIRWRVGFTCNGEPKERTSLPAPQIECVGK